MLRLVLQWFSDHADCKFISEENASIYIKENARWYSEALLKTEFARIDQHDELWESYTHADGVYGDFKIGDKGSEDLKLKPDWKQFVVLEAKMESPFSKGTTHAKGYNQAARIVACMAKIESDSKQKVNEKVNEKKDIAFYTLVPESQKNKFEKFIKIEEIKKTVGDRVDEYSRSKEPVDTNAWPDKKDWYDNHFCDFCERIKTKLITWEEIIEFIKSKDQQFGKELECFYNKCKNYNQMK
jgi:hypothetical protein